MRALFLGNSYTFTHDVPGQVEAMAREGGLPWTSEQVVEGGADWSLHAGRLGGLARIATGPELVVLQGRSTDPLLQPERFAHYGRVLGEAARHAGARVVLFQTWAWAPDHEAYRRRWSGGSPEAWDAAVRDAYASLAEALDAEIAPVGEVWARARRTRPDLELYDEDRHHPSPLGSHLRACALLRALTGLDPREVRFGPPDVAAVEGLALKALAASTD